MTQGDRKQRVRQALGHFNRARKVWFWLAGLAAGIAIIAVSSGGDDDDDDDDRGMGYSVSQLG